jgi:hypothetical protein
MTRIDMPDTWEIEKTATRIVGSDADDMASLIQDEASLIHDLIHLKLAQASALDYSPHLDFIAFEMASGWCYQSLYNGRRTADQLERAGRERNRIERERIEGVEVADLRLDRAEEKVEALQVRLSFWRRDYLASKLAYRQVVYWLQQDGQFGWLDSEWTPKERDRKLDEGARSSRRAGVQAKQQLNDQEIELRQHMDKEKLRQVELQLVA